MRQGEGRNEEKLRQSGALLCASIGDVEDKRRMTCGRLQSFLLSLWTPGRGIERGATPCGAPN